MSVLSVPTYQMFGRREFCGVNLLKIAAVAGMAKTACCFDGPRTWVQGPAAQPQVWGRCG